MRIVRNGVNRPMAAGMAAILGLATAMTVAPMDRAAAGDRGDRAAAAATGFAAGAVVGATVAQPAPRVYVAPRTGYYRSGYRTDCRTKVVKTINPSTGRSVTKKTTVCN